MIQVNIFSLSLKAHSEVCLVCITTAIVFSLILKVLVSRLFKLCPNNCQAHIFYDDHVCDTCFFSLCVSAYFLLSGRITVSLKHTQPTYEISTMKLMFYLLKCVSCPCLLSLKILSPEDRLNPCIPIHIHIWYGRMTSNLSYMHLPAFSNHDISAVHNRYLWSDCCLPVILAIG